MRKIILSFGSLLCVFISMAQVSDADKNAALQLVSANLTTLGLSAYDLNNLMVSSSYQDNTTGIRYVYLQQTFMDIPVYNQIQVISFRNNRMLSNAGGRITNIDQKINGTSGIPNISAGPAVMAAISDRNLTSNQPAIAINTNDNGRYIKFDNMGISRENITARLMWYPSADSSLVSLVWQVYIIPTTSSDYWLVRIDADNGNTLGADNLTVYCSWDDPHKNDFTFGTNSNNDQLNKDTGNNQLFDLKKIVELSGKSPQVPTLADNSVYRVIPLPYEAPSFMPGPSTTWHQLVTNPWTTTGVLPNAVTLKWHSTDIAGTDFNYTRGNNTWAYQDISNTNTGSIAKSASSTTALPNLNFDFTPDYTLAPTITSPPNQQFNITNLFYWNNIIHDVMYSYGFNEVSGNFQANNLGRGGVGNDHVNAEAQDGSGTNNANFATPPDGSQPRMQMFLFTAPTPDRDGDVDNGIIAHEYGHGISNRLTGGPAITTCLQNAEQMGEGWSDFQTLMFTQNWANSNLNTGFTNPRGMGTYVLNQAINGLGIRSQKYCTDFTINNKVYASSIPSTPHDRGEIWCAVLWDMTWNIIQQNGTINPNIYDLAGGGGNNIAWKLVIEGMKLQPCSPGFIDGRNAILQADLNLFGGTYQCAIKEAFRRRGMGDGASQGSSGSVNDQIPSFVLTDGGAILTLLQNVISSTPEGQNINYINRVVTGNCGAITNYKLTDTLPTNVTFVSANNGGAYNPGNRVVSWTINQGAGTTVDYLFSVNVNAGTYYAPVIILDEMVAGPPPTIPATWTTSAAPTNNLWISSNAQSHSTPNSFFTSNLATANDQILVNNNSLALTSPSPKLSFWGLMNSQVNRDGGVVEISTNGGGTWSDLGPQITSGGYNGTLNTSFNPLSGRPAFTGSSSGFVKTTINLAPYSCQANIKFRFRFGSDESTNGTGWYIDDILIQDEPRVEMRSSLFNGSSVRMQVSDSIMSITTSPGCTPPTVTCHPTNFNACVASNSSFSVGAVGTSSLTYQWQESTTGIGGPWNNIINGSIYDGATTATLTLTGVTLSMTDYQYRCIVTGQCAPPVTSNAATLSVNLNINAGTITGASPLCIGDTTTFASNGTVGGTWSSSNIAVATIDINTGLVTAVGAGTTIITYTVISGCLGPINAFNTLTVSTNVLGGAVSGSSSLCIGATSTYSSSGTITFSGTLGTGDPVLPSGRILRDGGVSNCAFPKICPGSLGGSGYWYDTYSYTNPLSTAACITITFTNTSPSAFQVASVYLGSFSPASICTNYLADFGLSPNPGTSATFSFMLPGSTTAVLMVSTVDVGFGGSYSMLVDGPITATGGEWSSSDELVATVNPLTGLVTSIGAGTTNITYTINAGSGCPASIFKTLTVNPNVSAGTISGFSPIVCIGAKVTYSSNGDAGGSWSSANSAVATVNPSTGLVTTVNAGTTNIIYTVNSGCGSPVSSVKTVTVIPGATAGTVSGVSPLCISETASFTSTGTVGGVWSSSIPAVATVDSVSGLVTAVNAGVTNIIYTLSAGCSSPISSFQTLTVSPNLSAGTVSGASSLCIGNSSTFTSSGNGGGSWSSSNSSVATVNSSTGVTTALSAGTTNITYSINSGCGSPVSSYQTLTINPNPTVNPVANLTVCNGVVTDSIIFSGNIAGTTYSWSNSNPFIGLAASGTGNIAGFTATNTSNVPVIATITVTPLSGLDNISFNFDGSLQNWTSALAGITCVGNNFSTNTWGLQTNAFEGTNSIGATTTGGEHSYIMSPLLSFGEGSKTISFKSFSNNESGYPCAWDVELIEISTNGGTTWTNINGGSVLNLNNVFNDAQWRTITLTTTTPATANGRLRFRYDTGDNFGGGTGINNGWYIDNVTISNTNACTGPPITFTITVNPNTSAGTVSGASPLCIEAIVNYISNGDTGGSWSSSNTAVATVDALTGVVTAISIGTTNIIYTVNTGCNNPVSSFKTLAVSEVLSPGTISGTSPFCIGTTTTYSSNGDAGGNWSSSNTAVATVNASTGLVTAVSAGTTSITYILTGCGNLSAFKILSVSPNLNAGTVSGGSPLCIGATTTYTTNGDAGGSWSSTNTAVATVNASTGLVTAISTGTSNITYTLIGCGNLSAFKTLTVSPNVSAGTISGIPSLCLGAIAIYTSSGTTAGSWSSSNPAVATVNAIINSFTGLVTALSAGTTNITYTVNSGCTPVSSFKTLTVSASLSPGTVSGTSPLCIGATATYTSNGAVGGNWSSTNTTVAIVHPSTGLVTAISAGTSNITYTLGGCFNLSAFKTLTVDAGTVNGTSPLCIGATTTYTSTSATGGSWTSTNTTVATVNASTGLVTAISAGITNITYTVSGCSGTAFKILTINPNVSAVTITGTSPLCIGATAIYTSSGTNGGLWSSTVPAVASVNSASGLVTALASGTTNIIYTINTGCGSPVSTIKSLTVNPSLLVTCPANSTVSIDTPPFALSGGSPAGGTYTGPGVSGGIFNPAAAGSGVNSITYSYADPSTGCINSCTFTITVQVPVIHGSVHKNADPTKINIVFKPTFTSVPGEYVNSLQFALAIPVAVSTGVTASAVGMNTFSNMGTLTAIPPYTQGSERIFTWIFADPSLATQSWTKEVDFIGVEVTFSTIAAAALGKMVDFTNINGGTNNQTYFSIASTASGDITDYDNYFYPISGQSILGNYSNSDQFVYTTVQSCPEAFAATAAGSTSFCAPTGGTPTITASGYSTGMAGLTHQWMSSTTATNPELSTPIFGQTNPASLTIGAITVTTYFWLKESCTNGPSTAYSNMVTVTINPEPVINGGVPYPVQFSAGPPLTLTASPAGGTFSGSGILFSPIFDPSMAPVGVNTITYISPDGCVKIFTITVSAISCPASVTISASGPNDFCSGLTLTANPYPTGTYTYQWNFGTTMMGTHQTLDLTLVDPDGDYTVTLIGCNTEPVSYTYTKQNLIQSYTILAFENVELGELNRVQNGAVGSIKSDGRVKVNKKSTIASPGFAKARKLEIHSSAVVPIRYAGAPVTVTLPTMQPNNTTPTGTNITIAANGTFNGNYKDVQVKKNIIATLTGTIFKKITVEEGANVTFTSSAINVEEFDIKNGKSGSGNRTRLNFAGNTVVRVEKKVDVHDFCHVNEAGHIVTFFVEKENFKVDGKGSSVLANVMAPNGNIEVHGDGTYKTYMTGQFIAKKVKSENKNVIWNAYDCNANNMIPIAFQSHDMNEIESRLQVRVFPNPSDAYFNLSALSSSKEIMNVTMYNVVGVKVQEIKAMPGQMMRLGDHVISGTYLIEVRQGNERAMVKVVKL